MDKPKEEEVVRTICKCEVCHYHSTKNINTVPNRMTYEQLFDEIERKEIANGKEIVL